MAQAAASVQMYVVAGLPPETNTFAQSYLRKKRPAAAVIGAPSTASDGALYPVRVVDTLLRAVAGFAIRRRTKGPATPVAPKSITLLYVPASDEERLLEVFDFAVLPWKLTALAAFGEYGRQFRHQSAAVEGALLDALDGKSGFKSNLDKISERIARLSDQEALLLPPNNYHTINGTVEQLFREYRRGHRAIDDRFSDLRSEKLTKEHLKKIPVGATRHVYIDSRDVAFPTAHPTAFHGALREIDEQATTQDLQSTLRGLYRFGASLPRGFHHDAQRRDGRNFHDFPFNCTQDGCVVVTATHANVFANDFVRASEKRKI